MITLENGLTKPVAVSPATTLMQRLQALAAVRAGLPVYYRSLASSSDHVIRTGAMMALLDLKAIEKHEWSSVLSLCSYGGVKRRAFDYFQGLQEASWAEKVALTATPNDGAIASRKMLAALRFDDSALIEVAVEQFLASGRIEHLWNATSAAEGVGGWKLGADWAARAMLLAPGEMTCAQRLLDTLAEANQDELVGQVCNRLLSFGLNPTICSL